MTFHEVRMELYARSILEGLATFMEGMSDKTSIPVSVLQKANEMQELAKKLNYYALREQQRKNEEAIDRYFCDLDE